MKLYILIAFAVTAFAASDLPEQCQLPAHPGFCKMLLLRWWYNAEKGQCEEFFFGGCSGNANNFETKELCEHTCSVHAHNQRRKRRIETYTDYLLRLTGPVCERLPFRGRCEYAIERFYYNPARKSCRTFTWSGCGTNLNNFKTEKACMEACGPRKPPTRKPIM
nr:boophilin-H2-like [Rhipicephalus microplus]